MIVVTTDKIPGKKIIEAVGVVTGSSIRAKWIGKDILSGIRNIIGGEMKEYTEMLTEARQIALERMISKAEYLDADAVVNLRFATSQVMSSAAEILAYGTAVKIEKSRGKD